MHLLDKLFTHNPRPLIMGILNVTPDSFSDGNQFSTIPKAIEHVKKLIDDGADLIDVGGESSRPGSKSVTVDEEIRRVVPVIEKIRQFTSIPLSIDTRKAEVARLSIEAGANIINDISALRFDNSMVELLKKYPTIGIIIMHMQGDPSNMQNNPQYIDVISEINNFFLERITFCSDNQIEHERILLDPGIGFGKLLSHNLQIIKNVEYFRTLKLPLVLGASRKRFINDISPSEPTQRLAGSLAVTAIIWSKVDVIRVHDVFEHKQFCSVMRLLQQ